MYMIKINGEARIAVPHRVMSIEEAIEYSKDLDSLILKAREDKLRFTEVR